MAPKRAKKRGNSTGTEQKLRAIVGLQIDISILVLQRVYLPLGHTKLKPVLPSQIFGDPTSLARQKKLKSKVHLMFCPGPFPSVFCYLSNIIFFKNQGGGGGGGEEAILPRAGDQEIQLP